MTLKLYYYRSVTQSITNNKNIPRIIKLIYFAKSQFSVNLLLQIVLPLQILCSYLLACDLSTYFGIPYFNIFLEIRSNIQIAFLIHYVSYILLVSLCPMGHESINIKGNKIRFLVCINLTNKYCRAMPFWKCSKDLIFDLKWKLP